MKEEWQNTALQMAEMFREIKRQRPLIHMIPNGVSAALCADGLSALGARPLMAVEVVEMQEITEQSDASVVNLGQLNQEKYKAAERALRYGAAYGKPLVLDPVGCGASSFRLRAAQELLALPWYGLVKGNGSEIYSIQRNQLTREGIDCVTERALSRDIPEGRVYLVTGRSDRILRRGKEETIFRHGKTKERSRYNIVGTGCLAGAVAGACYSVESRLRLGQYGRVDIGRQKQQGSAETGGRQTAEKVQEAAGFAAAAASLGMAFALEAASEETGYGSAKTALLDALGRLSNQEFQDWLQRLV